jgi:hypothetical protein
MRQRAWTGIWMAVVASAILPGCLGFEIKRCACEKMTSCCCGKACCTGGMPSAPPVVVSQSPPAPIPVATPLVPDQTAGP